MKKAFAVMMMVLFLAGCGAAARESGYYEHNTMYRDWDHLKFSIYGYKTLEQKEIQESKDQRLVGENHLEHPGSKTIPRGSGRLPISRRRTAGSRIPPRDLRFLVRS